MSAKVTAPAVKKPAKRPPPAKRPELKDIVSGAGQPLDVGLRRELEAKLGHDFSRVRIHTDRDAAALAELVGADAVAVGQDVFFAEDAFHPETAQGRLLLAHELLHTVQVPTAPGPLRLGRVDGILSQPNESVEVEAEEAAHSRRDEIGRREQQSASLLRFTRVTADQHRSERLDPAAIVDRIVAGVLRSLRGDPADTSGRVRLQLGRLSPELQQSVLDALKVQLPSPEYQQVLDLIGKVEDTAAAPDVAPSDKPESVVEPDPDQQRRDQADNQTAKDDQQAERDVDKGKEDTGKSDQRTQDDERKRQQDKDKQDADKKDGDQQAKQENDQKDKEKKDKENKDAGELAEQDKKNEKDDKDKGKGEQDKQEADKKEADGKQGEQQAKQGQQPTEPVANGAAAVGAPAGGAPVAGGAPEVADASVDAAVQGPDSPLVKHGVLERPGERPKEEAEPGEEPLGLEAAPTAEVAEPQEAPPAPPQPAPQEQEPSDGLPKSDLDVSAVPTADKLTLPADGAPPPPPAPPSFPTPPEPEQKPAEDAKARTDEYRAEQERSHRETPEIQQAPGQVDAEAVDREPKAPVEQPAQPQIPVQRAAPVEQPEPAPDTAGVPQEGGPQAEPEAGPVAAQAEAAPGQAQPEDGSLEAGGGGCAGAPEPATDTQGGGGCGGGGGGAAPAEAPAQPAAPDVSNQEPRAALAAVGTQPPADMQQSLGQVDNSVGQSVDKGRTELRSAPPTTERPSGAPQTLSGNPPEAPVVATAVARVAEAKPEGEGKQQQAEDKNVHNGPPATANAAAPNVAGDAQGKLSPEESAHLENAVDGIPTSDPALHATVGPAPQFELHGETDPALTDQQAKNLNDTTGQVAEVGKQDAAQPLGEDHIYPNVPQQTLTAKVPAGGGAGAPQAKAGGPGAPAAGAVDSAAISAVAQQERGPQIQAAFGQGAGTMATEQQGNDQQTAQAHQQNRADIDAAVKESSAQQADQRGQASEQAKAQREEWRGEQDKAVGDANTQAQDKHGGATKEIDKQHTDTNTGIEQRQQGDNKDIDDKRAKAEEDARKKKEEKKNDSGGIFSWIASKIKEAFDAIVSAITEVFNAARKLIQGVIDGFKKFVNDAIEFARKAVVGLITVFANALILLGDTLLAAFPGLRDKFRKAIQGLRDAAIAKVNQLADGLKNAVNKLLDALGAALSKLLDLLQKGLLAAVEFVRSAVNAAIAFVQQAIAILGEFAAIIKDIATNPFAWLGKLGAAIRDGVRNFLFGAIITAVKKWFNDKVEEVVGLGKLIFNVLVKGCLKIGQIASMVWQAVIKALPMMIVQLVLEKVVAALIPGAGAILAIIQTIIAAWNTISKILGAISKLVSFLKAVKTGGVAAACLFAQTVAAGAVALLDFITNFLVSKLSAAAKGVASKLKGFADKIMKALARGAQKVRQFAGKAFNAGKKAATAGVAALKRGVGKVAGLARRGLGKVGQLAKRGWNRVKGGIKALGSKLAKTKLGKALVNAGNKIKQGYQKAKQKVADWWKDRRKPKQPLTAEERLAKAIARIKPKLGTLLKKGSWELVVRALLVAMRGWYRLTGLALSSNSETFTITATVNPSGEVDRGYRVTSDGFFGRAVKKALGADLWLLFLDKRNVPKNDAVSRWEKGLAAIRGFARDTRQSGVSSEALFGFLVAARSTYEFKTLEAAWDGKGWRIHATMNPDNQGDLIPISGKVLLVGEGNFSFTAAVVALGLNLPGNITATEAKSEAQAAKEDPQSVPRTRQLRAQGVTVEYGVDARRLHEKYEDRPKFDNIIWILPHPGVRLRLGAVGQELLRAFFRSAEKRLAKNGRITIALIPKRYEALWRPAELAAEAGLALVSRAAFVEKDYPGYTFTTTAQGAKPPDLSEVMIFVFARS